MMFDTDTMTFTEIQAALWENFKQTYPDFKYDDKFDKPDERLVLFLKYQIINHLGGFHRNLLDGLIDGLTPESIKAIQMKSIGYLYLYMICFAAAHEWVDWLPDDFQITRTTNTPEIIINFHDYIFGDRWHAINTLAKHHGLDPEECFRYMAHRILNSDEQPIYHFEGNLK